MMRLSGAHSITRSITRLPSSWPSKTRDRTRGEHRECPPVTGQTVLVHGVRGAVSSLAAQLARWAGATVIGTVRTDAEAGQARAETAGHVVSLERALVSLP